MYAIRSYYDDYKPSAAQKPKKSKALQWFVVGLGLPLAGLAFVSELATTTPPATPPEEPVMTAIDAVPYEVEERVELVYAETPLVITSYSIHYTKLYEPGLARCLSAVKLER